MYTSSTSPAYHVAPLVGGDLWLSKPTGCVHNASTIPNLQSCSSIHLSALSSSFYSCIYLKCNRSACAASAVSNATASMLHRSHSATDAGCRCREYALLLLAWLFALTAVHSPHMTVMLSCLSVLNRGALVQEGSLLALTAGISLQIAL